MLIVSDVAEYLRDHQGPVALLSDRKQHCETLQGMLIDLGVKSEILTGSLGNKQRRKTIEKIHGGDVQAIVATGSLIGEGFDLPALSAMFMCTPLKFEGRVTQYIGRVLRPAPGKDRAVIFDYIDAEPVLMASARARQLVYEKAA